MNKTPDCPKYLGMILRHARKQYNIQLENMATILRTTSELLKKIRKRAIAHPATNSGTYFYCWNWIYAPEQS